MRWGRIDNKTRIQPARGEYSEWKIEVAEICYHRCVYCGIHESRYGGLDNYHVDHFRPKSLSCFAHLVNVITNLYLACAICNRFKSNDWPNDPAADHSLPCYPDPGEFAYSDLFVESPATHRLTGKFPAATYVIERLGLNRPQLLIDRRTDHLLGRASRVKEIFDELEMGPQDKTDPNFVKALHLLAKGYSELFELVQQVFQARPYQPGDQKKR